MNAISKSALMLSSSFVTALWAQCASGLVYSVTEIPSLGGDTFGHAVNDSGQVAGYSYLSASGTGTDAKHAFIFGNGVITDIGTLPGFGSSQGFGINATGAVTGVLVDYSVQVRHAFLYNNGVMQDLGTLSGYASTTGIGINSSGQITGVLQTTNNTISHAFLYDDGAMSDLGTLGGTNSQGNGINDSGQITGFADVAGTGNSHAFLFSGGVLEDLGTLGGTWSSGTGINSSGQVTGYSGLSGDAAADAFLYSNGTMQDLGTPGGESQAWGINDSAQIVGNGSPLGNPSHALLYTDGQWFDLNSLLDPNSPYAPYVTLYFAFGISNNGNIVAVGVDSRLSANYVTFLLTPIINSAPTVNPTITGTLGNNAWYVSKTTTLTWTVTGYPAPTTSGCGAVSVPQTTGTTYTCSATNSLGSASKSVLIKEDSVKPSVVIKKPAANAVYALNQKVVASYSCLDATSGVASCSGTVANGAAINTSTLGIQTFAVTGTDNAGNTITKTVLYAVAPAAATPVFSLKAGTYRGAQKVSITDATPGTTIHYTTNGTTPTTSSPLYTGTPITISSTKTLKADAIAPGYARSAVRSAEYTIT